MNYRYAWIEWKGKGMWRPFTECREITKGKHRGMIEITLMPTPARKMIVDPGAIREHLIGDKP